MKNIECKIVSKKKYYSHKKISMKFEIINNTGQDVYIYKWGTPLEGIMTDCLTVKNSKGKKIEYDGLFIYREKPDKKAFLFLKNGKKSINEIEISGAYNVSSGNKYSVECNSRNIMVFSAVDMKIDDFKKRKMPSSLKTVIENTPAVFEVVKKGKKKQTIGENFRKEEKNKFAKKKSDRGLESVKEPTFEGGTDEQHEITLRAHRIALDFCENVLLNFANDELYNIWFGAHTDSRFQLVKSNFTKIKEGLEQTQFNYYMTGQNCIAGMVAVTYKGATQIGLCDLFWERSDEERAAALLHEHSHASAWTLDYVYGSESCEQLAIDRPDDAIKNADNYEFYVEDTQIPA